MVAAPMSLTVNSRPQEGQLGRSSSRSSNSCPQLGQLRMGTSLLVVGAGQLRGMFALHGSLSYESPCRSQFRTSRAARLNDCFAAGISADSVFDSVGWGSGAWKRPMVP